MKNTLRTPDFMLLRRLINGCASYLELIGIDFLIYEFAAHGTDEGRDLIQVFIEKKSQLKTEVK